MENVAGELAASRARVALPLIGIWRPSRSALAGLIAGTVALLVLSSLTTRFSPFWRTNDYDGGIASTGGGFAGSGFVSPDASAPQVAIAPQAGAAIRAPMVIHTATLLIVATDFSRVRAAVEGVVSETGGFIDQMTVSGNDASARRLHGTLRVPGDRMAAAVARLRAIGQVVQDTQGSQDVTDQLVDLDARLASARATEKRLTELLTNRTGKLSEVLEVERESARVRLDIERLDAERTNMGRRVSYATIGVTVAEERNDGLGGPVPLATRIRVAAADGLAAAIEGVTATLLFILRAGPSLVVWGSMAAFVWLVVRRRAVKPSDCLS